MFELSVEEYKSLIFSMRSQFVTTSTTKRPISYAIYAFTEQGVAMLSSVLRSDKAIEVNIAIMRTFVAIREMVYALDNNVNKEIELLKDKVSDIEKGCNDTLRAVNDLSEDMREELDDIYLALGELAKKNKSLTEQDSHRNPIGFKRKTED